MIPVQITDDDLLTMQQLAALLNCSDKTIYRRIRDGLFPRPVRITDRLVRWPRQVINEFLAASL